MPTYTGASWHAEPPSPGRAPPVSHQPPPSKPTQVCFLIRAGLCPSPGLAGPILRWDRTSCLLSPSLSTPPERSLRPRGRLDSLSSSLTFILTRGPEALSFPPPALLIPLYCSAETPGSWWDCCNCPDSLKSTEEVVSQPLLSNMESPARMAIH